MRKEIVVVDVDPRIPQPYQNYIRARNGCVGRDLADLLGVPRVVCSGKITPEMSAYVVPAKTVDMETSARFNIRTVDDFYGTMVDSLFQVGKSILHPVVSGAPKFYSSSFAERVRNLVLPGCSAFSMDDLLRGYDRYAGNGFGLRFKQSNESDGLGQRSVTSRESLLKQAAVLDPRALCEEGVVLEADLLEARTISVGFARIGQDTFSFVAKQKNDMVGEKGTARSRYLGAQVLVVKGDIMELLLKGDCSFIGPDESRAVAKAVRFNRIYQEEVRPLASRLSFDVLFGFTNHGDRLCGITDITGRLGGTCPALLTAALRFKEMPATRLVKAEVTLNYHPDRILPEEENSKVYLDCGSLRLSARINQVLC